MPESKIVEVPGVPVVIATVGAWYPEFIDRWLREHPIDPKKYAVVDFAERFVADYFAHHERFAVQRLAENGLSVPASGEFKKGSRERLLASAQVVIAGTQPGAPRAQLWTADFPNSAVEPAHFKIAEGGREELATVHLCGNYEPIERLLDAIDSASLTQEQSAEMVEFALGTAEKFDRWSPGELSPRLMAPFDVVRVTHAGVEWVVRPQVENSHPHPAGVLEYVAGFDSAGVLKNSTTLNANVPNSTACVTDLLIYYSYTYVGAGSVNKMVLGWDNGAGGDATLYLPSGITYNLGHNLSKYTDNASNFTTGTNRDSYFVYAYFTPTSPGVSGSAGTMTYTVQKNTPFTIAQVKGAYADGGYVVAQATASGSPVTAATTTSGSGGKAPSGGRAQN
jgi:hypothetical protein